MQCRAALPRHTAQPPKLPSRAPAFFAPPRRNSASFNNNHTEARALLHKAETYKKERDYLKAENIYKKIVYEVDPTFKEAYDGLTSLWSKQSVFGFTQEKVDELLNQYKKHVKNGETQPTSPGTAKPR